MSRAVVASIFMSHEISVSCARNSCTTYGYRKNLEALGHRKQVPQRKCWHAAMHSNVENGILNSADPDQTTFLGAV